MCGMVVVVQVSFDPYKTKFLSCMRHISPTEAGRSKLLAIDYSRTQDRTERPQIPAFMKRVEELHSLCYTETFIFPLFVEKTLHRYMKTEAHIL